MEAQLIQKCNRVDQSTDQPSVMIQMMDTLICRTVFEHERIKFHCENCVAQLCTLCVTVITAHLCLVTLCHTVISCGHCDTGVHNYVTICRLCTTTAQWRKK
jgi:hypothetical protein